MDRAAARLHGPSELAGKVFEDAADVKDKGAEARSISFALVIPGLVPGTQRSAGATGPVVRIESTRETAAPWVPGIKPGMTSLSSPAPHAARGPPGCR